jgi:hypothetical protein
LEIRVSKLLRIAAGATDAARLVRLRASAEEKLSEPEREPLLAHAAGAMDQETRRQGAALDGGAQALLEIVVAVEIDDGHRFVDGSV